MFIVPIFLPSHTPRTYTPAQWVKQSRVRVTAWSTDAGAPPTEEWWEDINPNSATYGTRTETEPR